VDDFNITLKTLAKLWHKKIVENRTSFVIDWRQRMWLWCQ